MLFGSGQENEEWVFFCLGSVVCLKLAACLANLKNKVRYIRELVEKYWGGSVQGLSGRHHMAWLDHRLGTAKLMSHSAGSGWGHKTHGTQWCHQWLTVWALMMLHQGPFSPRSQPSLAGQTRKAALETTLRGKVSITWAVMKQQSRWLTGS